MEVEVLAALAEGQRTQPAAGPRAGEQRPVIDLDRLAAEEDQRALEARLRPQAGAPRQVQPGALPEARVAQVGEPRPRAQERLGHSHHPALRAARDMLLDQGQARALLEAHEQARQGRAAARGKREPQRLGDGHAGGRAHQEAVWVMRRVVFLEPSVAGSGQRAEQPLGEGPRRDPLDAQAGGRRRAAGRRRGERQERTGRGEVVRVGAAPGALLGAGPGPECLLSQRIPPSRARSGG